MIKKILILFGLFLSGFTGNKLNMQWEYLFNGKNLD